MKTLNIHNIQYITRLEITIHWFLTSYPISLWDTQWKCAQTFGGLLSKMYYLVKRTNTRVKTWSSYTGSHGGTSLGLLKASLKASYYIIILASDLWSCFVLGKKLIDRRYRNKQWLHQEASLFVPTQRFSFINLSVQWPLR